MKLFKGYAEDQLKRVARASVIAFLSQHEWSDVWESEQEFTESFCQTYELFGHERQTFTDEFSKELNSVVGIA